MKTVGRTNDGGHLVELSDMEYKTLMRLWYTVEGNDDYVYWFYDEDARAGATPGVIDLADTFLSIRRWIESRFMINEMQRQVNGLKRLLSPDRVYRDGDYDDANAS